MVEQWSPKPKVKGSNPFSPDLTTNAKTRGPEGGPIPNKKLPPRRCGGPEASAVTIRTKKCETLYFITEKTRLQ